MHSNKKNNDDNFHNEQNIQQEVDDTSSIEGILGKRSKREEEEEAHEATVSDEELTSNVLKKKKLPINTVEEKYSSNILQHKETNIDDKIVSSISISSSISSSSISSSSISSSSSNRDSGNVSNKNNNGKKNQKKKLYFSFGLRQDTSGSQAHQLSIENQEHTAPSTSNDNRKLEIPRTNNEGGNAESPSLPHTPTTPSLRKAGLQLVKCIDTQCIYENYRDSHIKSRVVSPGSIQLHWEHIPKNILLIRQLYNKKINDHVLWIAKYLIESKNCTVFVERHVLKDLRKWKKSLSTFLSSPCPSSSSKETINLLSGTSNKGKECNEEANISKYEVNLDREEIMKGAEQEESNHEEKMKRDIPIEIPYSSSAEMENNHPSGHVPKKQSHHYEKCKERYALLTQVLNSERFTTYYKKDEAELQNLIDMIICLGGDGTILHTAQQFQSGVPPILGFNFGSIGFLTNFEMKNYKESIDRSLAGQVFLSIRMRLNCKIQRNDGTVDQKRYQVLNEVTIDRGPSPYLTSLECYCSNTMITNVQADGLIVATPTGSTAYSMSAGGGIVHPGVPCILLTPISPHSLSFRPLVLPDSTVLKIKVPLDARCSAWVSFDGKDRQEIQKGDSIVITTSIWPVPLICTTEETSEWFLNLTRCLHWNLRKPQKPLENPSDDSPSPPTSPCNPQNPNNSECPTSAKTTSCDAMAKPEADDDDDDDDDDDELSSDEDEVM